MTDEFRVRHRYIFITIEIPPKKKKLEKGNPFGRIKGSRGLNQSVAMISPGGKWTCSRYIYCFSVLIRIGTY